MARYNEILAGRYNRALQKLLSMKGEPPSPQLASEIVPSLTMFWGVEMRYLEGWDLFTNNVFVAAVAASVGGVRLRNPAGSNVVAVFEKITAISTPGLKDQPTLTHGPTNVDLASIGSANNARLDARGKSNQVLIVSSASPATSLSSYSQASFAADGMAEFIVTDIQEIPLLPGDGLQITAATVNQGITASFRWRERFLEDSERT